MAKLMLFHLNKQWSRLTTHRLVGEDQKVGTISAQYKLLFSASLKWMRSILLYILFLCTYASHIRPFKLVYFKTAGWQTSFFMESGNGIVQNKGNVRVQLPLEAVVGQLIKLLQSRMYQISCFHWVNYCAVTSKSNASLLFCHPFYALPALIYLFRQK